MYPHIRCVIFCIFGTGSPIDGVYVESFKQKTHQGKEKSVLKVVSHLHNHTENASEKIIFVTIMRKNKLDVFVY